MNESIVGKRYAKALLNLAGNDEQIEKIGAEIQEIANLYQDDIAFQALLHQPKLSQTKKISFIDDITKTMKCERLVNKFCRFLVSKKRFEFIPDISKAFNTLVNKKLGKATANVTVAHKLTKNEEENLQKQLSDYLGKKITLKVEVDASVLGGAITSIESIVIDGSIKNKLNLIHQTISKGM